MKKNIKFIVAVFAISIATFGTLLNANAKKDNEVGGRACVGFGVCGFDNYGKEIPGHTS